jgi:hypothetical protein
MGIKQKEALAWYGLKPKQYKVTKKTAETLYLKHKQTGQLLTVRW